MHKLTAYAIRACEGSSTSLYPLLFLTLDTEKSVNCQLHATAALDSRKGPAFHTESLGPDSRKEGIIFFICREKKQVGYRAVVNY